MNHLGIIKMKTDWFNAQKMIILFHVQNMYVYIIIHITALK